MARVAIGPASRRRRVTCCGVIVIGPPSNFGRGYYRDAHFAVLFRAVRLPSAVIESCLPGTVARLADAYFRRVRSLAAGPAAKAYSGSLIGRPVTRSTRIGSTASPVLVLTSSTLAPSGAKCLLPQANNATTTGRKSRPRAGRTYSERGGRSLWRRGSSSPASTRALSRRVSMLGAIPRLLWN